MEEAPPRTGLGGARSKADTTRCQVRPVGKPWKLGPVVEKSNARLKRGSTDASSAVEELEISYDGAEMEIGFNARYLLDIASQVESDIIEFALADQGSPSLVRAPGDESTLFVLMPMRV